MSISIYLKPKLLGQLKARAAKESRSVSSMISVILTEALGWSREQC